MSVFDTLFFCLSVILFISALISRIKIYRVASSSSVDAHYWFLLARAYSEQCTLPVRIQNKYLLEDETQAYPPFFGWILGRLLKTDFFKWTSQIFELTNILVLGVILFALNLSLEMILVALAWYVAAPILVVYNSQLTPRILGDFFLFFSMALQVFAVMLESTPWLSWVLWTLSAFFLGMMVSTHKMSLQLHLVLLPFWWWALSKWQVPLATAVGIVIFIMIVGPRFAYYQFRAHWDIVSFWHRHWKNLGAHQFDSSPIYGDPSRNFNTCFHQTGWRGVFKHLRVVVSYAPLNLFLPLCSYITGVWPPLWLIIWISVIYIWAFATLFVPKLKCMGGGHLYIFNAIAPGAIYIGYLPPNMNTFWILFIGTLLTILSLKFAIRSVKNRPNTMNEDLKSMLDELNKIPQDRIAVFPLQVAELIAAKTNHAVLWGGHGFGFERLECFWPVVTRPLGHFFQAYGVGMVVWDSHYWSAGEERMTAEKIINPESVENFGHWRLVKTSVGS